MSRDDLATVVQDEPDDDGQWVTAEPLYTNEILGLALCKYGGKPPMYVVEDGAVSNITCPERDRHQHPDTDCIVMFWSTLAISAGNIPTAMVAPIVTTNNGDTTFIEPINP